jgi:hypothetical protein
MSLRQEKNVLLKLYKCEWELRKIEYRKENTSDYISRLEKLYQHIGRFGKLGQLIFRFVI